MGFDEILRMVHEMQGAADPNHNPADIAERMQKIWELACEIMDRTGWQPD